MNSYRELHKRRLRVVHQAETFLRVKQAQPVLRAVADLLPVLNGLAGRAPNNQVNLIAQSAWQIIEPQLENLETLSLGAMADQLRMQPEEPGRQTYGHYAKADRERIKNLLEPIRQNPIFFHLIERVLVNALDAVV